jgi:hypothetical protein
MIRCRFISIVFLITGCQLCGCNQNIKIYNMNIEKTIDFEFLEKIAEKYPMPGHENYYQYYLKRELPDHAISIIDGNRIDGFDEWVTPPVPAFYQIFITYYANGNLKKYGKIIGGGGIRIGIWEYYDEKGNKVKEVNEDEKFGKFGYNELLQFLHLNKYINLETGENRDQLIIVFDEKDKKWGVNVTDIYYVTTYLVIDGETGKIKSEEKYQGGEE